MNMRSRSDADTRRISVEWKLWTTQDEGMGLMQRHILNSGTWSSNDKDGFEIHLVLEGTSRAIYAARPTEMLRSGPVVVFLPLEYDHTPDAWEPMMFGLYANGGPFERKDIEELLAVCGPADRVADVREWIKKVDERTGYPW